MQKHELDSAQKLYGLSPVLSSLGTKGRFTVFTVVESFVEYSISAFIQPTTMVGINYVINDYLSAALQFCTSNKSFN